MVTATTARNSLFSASAARGEKTETASSIRPVVSGAVLSTIDLTVFPIKDASTSSYQTVATPGFANASGIAQFERQHRNDNFIGPSTVVSGAIITGSAERPIFSTTDYLGGPDTYTIEFQEASLNTLNIFTRGPSGSNGLLSASAGSSVGAAGILDNVLNSATKDFQNFYYKGDLLWDDDGVNTVFGSGSRGVDFGSARGTMRYAAWAGTRTTSTPIIVPYVPSSEKTDYELLLYSGKTSDDISSYVTLPDDKPLATRGFSTAQYAGVSVFVEVLNENNSVTILNGKNTSAINWFGIGVTVQQRPSRGNEWFDSNVVIETSGTVNVSNARQRNDNFGSIMSIKRWDISGTAPPPATEQTSSLSTYIGESQRFMFNITFNNDEDNDFGNNMRLRLHPTGALDQSFETAGYLATNRLKVKVHAIMHKKLSAETTGEADSIRQLAQQTTANVIMGNER